MAAMLCLAAHCVSVSSFAYSPSVPSSLPLSPGTLPSCSRIRGSNTLSTLSLSLSPFPVFPFAFWKTKSEQAQEKALQFHEAILNRRTVNDFDPELPEDWEPGELSFLQTQLLCFPVLT